MASLTMEVRLLDLPEVKAELERLRAEVERLTQIAEEYRRSCCVAQEGNVRMHTEVERLREVLVEHERKLVEVWGKEQNPYAFAYGWVKPLRDAALAGAPSSRPQPRPMLTGVPGPGITVAEKDKGAGFDANGSPVP